jgi:hypothetical protein
MNYPDFIPVPTSALLTDIQGLSILLWHSSVKPL